MIRSISCASIPASKSARLAAGADRLSGRVTLTEGKYHEIKRMMAALGSPVTALARVSFAGIPLDPTLPRGACRPVTEEELQILRAAATKPPHE